MISGLSDTNVNSYPAYVNWRYFWPGHTELMRDRIFGKFSKVMKEDLKSKITWIILLPFLAIISCKQDIPVGEINQGNFQQSLERVYNEVVLEENYESLNDVEIYVVTNNVLIKEDYYRALYMYLLSIKYSNIKSYEISTNYARQAMAIFETLPGSDVQIAHCLNCIGINALHSGQERSIVQSYFQDAIDIAERANCTQCLMVYYFNLASLGSHGGSKETSYNYAKKLISLINEHNIKRKFLKYLNLVVSDYYVEQKNYVDALSNLEQAKEHSPEDHFYLQKAIYGRYAKLYAETGQQEKAVENFLKSLDYDRKLIVENIKEGDANLKAASQLNLSINDYKTKLIGKQRLLIFLIIGIILTGLLAITIINGQKRTLKQKSKEVDNLNESLQKSILNTQQINKKLAVTTAEVNNLLELNKRTLFTKNLQLSTIRDHLATISSKMNTLLHAKEVPGSALLALHKNLDSLITGQSEIWEDFKTQFEQINPGLFKKLKKEYPNLTVNDLKHCAYILSNLNSKEVAKLVNISSRSVETTRYRIKKKLGLPPHEDLYYFLQQF